MKNSHGNMDPTDGCKKFKRKDRKEKSSDDPEDSMDSVAPLLKEVYRKTRGKKFQRFHPTGQYLPDILNSALDMNMYTLQSLTRKEPETVVWSISETSRKDSPASLQVSVSDNKQTFSVNYPPPQPRILLCKRSERSLCVNSPGSFLHDGTEAADSSRNRAEEASAGVTEIKAIQQTRRLLANARERTRVHTISAAFEALRKQVPCYSYGQKLSKLAILRIACNYILSLAQLVDLDYTPDHSNMSFRECVEQCTKTLQAEGRAKKRKE